MPQELTSKYLYKWNENLYMFIQNSYINIHNGFILATAKNWTNSRCPSTVELIKEWWYIHIMEYQGSRGGSDDKESACNAGDTHSIPGSGRSPWEENGNSLQYSCLKNSMDRGAWQAIVHGVANSQTWLSD